MKVANIYAPFNPEAVTTNAITKPAFCTVYGVDYIHSEPLKPYTVVNQFQPDEALKYRDAAKKELEAAGVTLPIVAYMPYNTGGSDGDMAVTVTQQLEDLLGEDLIKFVIEGYPSTDYRNTCRRCSNYIFQLCCWEPDYADPLTFTDPFRIGQAFSYLWRADGAATQVSEGTPGARLGCKGWDECWWLDHDYTNMVAEASKETVDMEERYNALAECEAWLLAYITKRQKQAAERRFCSLLLSYRQPISETQEGRMIRPSFRCYEIISEWGIPIHTERKNCHP